MRWSSVSTRDGNNSDHQLPGLTFRFKTESSRGWDGPSARELRELHAIALQGEALNVQSSSITALGVVLTFESIEECVNWSVLWRGTVINFDHVLTFIAHLKQIYFLQIIK